MSKVSSLILVFTLLLANFAGAEERREVLLITAGPGDAVWEKFGHNMIWIRDPDRGIDHCYNWGLFDFDEPGFIWRFVQGRMTYWMDAFSPRSLDIYRLQRRQMNFDRVLLTDAQIAELFIRCETNRLPQNKRYKYDYFRDNCSTRVRDMLNEATGGALKREIDAQTPAHPMSYREHSIRLMQDDLLLSLGVDFALGPSCDRKLTAWEEGFLPDRLRTYSKSLLTPQPALWTSDRPPEPGEIPDRRLALLAAGVVGGAIMVALAWARRRWLRRVAAGLAIGWWVLAGIGGIFMSYVWLFTDHIAGYANQNLMQFSPLALLVLAGWQWARRRHAKPVEEHAETPVVVTDRSPQTMTMTTTMTMRALLLAVVGLGLVGLLGHAAGLFSQANLGFIALGLPLNIAAGLTVWRSVRQHRHA